MTKSVELTPDEVQVLADYLDNTLIAHIAGKDNEVDNLNWVYLMTSIWRKCELAQRGEGNGRVNQPTEDS